ncbi:unnamed protein product [Durusdinium trenchii]
MVMVVVILVMLFLIPLIVYSLSDTSSSGSGHKLLEGDGTYRQAGPSRSAAGSQRQLRTPGSQRLSVESKAVLPPTAAQYSPSDGPPVICRELVLPETEARFLIEAASLRSGSATQKEVIILGGSGRQPLLVAYLKDGGLSLHSMGANSMVVESPRAVVLPGRSPHNFEILDRDFKSYGELESISGRMTLRCNGQPVLLIDEMPEELGYNASQLDGRTLATGRLAPEVPAHVLQKLGGEAWRLRVVAGCDAIVVLSTMLTAMLIKTQRFRSGSITPSAPGTSATPSIRVSQVR